MFKVISAEFKKVVSKPGIYILSVLLAILLVGGVFIYKPTVYANTAIELNGTSVLQKQQYFENTILPKVDEDINATINSVLYYNVANAEGFISHQENISRLVNDFKAKLKNYLDCANETSAVVDSYINSIARPELVGSMEKLNSAIDTAINKAKSGSYAVITTEENYKTYTEAYSGAYSLLKTNVTKSKIAETVHFAKFRPPRLEGSRRRAANEKAPSDFEGANAGVIFHPTTGVCGVAPIVEFSPFLEHFGVGEQVAAFSVLIVHLFHSFHFLSFSLYLYYNIFK